MAKGNLYLRPSADVSVGHNLFPADSTAAYLLINEETSDDNATYISSSSVSEGVSTSKFKLSNTSPFPEKRFIVNSVNIVGDAYDDNSIIGSSKNEFILEINGIETALVTTTEKKTFDFSAADAITLINAAVAQNGVLPDINITVKSYSSSYSANNGKEGIGVSGVSQLYVAIGYEEILDIYKKVNGEWKPAKAVYKKIGSAWYEIYEFEFEKLLQGKTFCTK